MSKYKNRPLFNDLASKGINEDEITKMFQDLEEMISQQKINSPASSAENPSYQKYLKEKEENMLNK